MQKKAKSVKNSFGNFQESEVYEELTYRDLDREVRKLLKPEVQNHISILVLGFSPGTNTLLVEIGIIGYFIGAGKHRRANL